MQSRFDYGASLLYLKCLVYHVMSIRVNRQGGNDESWVFFIISPQPIPSIQLYWRRGLRSWGLIPYGSPEHPIFPVTTVSPFPLGGPIPPFLR